MEIGLSIHATDLAMDPVDVAVEDISVTIDRASG